LPGHAGVAHFGGSDGAIAQEAALDEDDKGGPGRGHGRAGEGVGRGFRGAVSDVDLRLLRVFRTVVEQGGFAPAEVVLGKSKSAISLDITAIEERLGARLCTRGRGGFALTDEGRVVHLAALQLFDDLDAFRDRVAMATKRLTGSVTLFLVDNIVSIAAAPIANALGAFARRHPRVALTLESATPGGVEAAVLDGRADFGVSVVPRAVPELDAVPLFREELLLYCGRDHPLFAAATEAAPEAVRVHALVKPSVTDDAVFAALIAGFPLKATASNLDARVLLVLSGAFLGFLPPHYAGAWVARGELAAVRPDIFRTENEFRLLTRKSARRSAAGRELQREMLVALGRMGASSSPSRGG
jgi:DNA-binding transcriptional LysR family regulator